MVHREQHKPLRVGHPHRHSTQQRPGGQVERPSRRLAQHLARGAGAEVSGVVDVHRDLPHGVDDLEGMSGGVRDEPGPQDLVRGGQGSQRCTERVRREIPLDPQPHRDRVLGPSRRQLVQKPEALLREGQRQGTRRPVRPRDRGTGSRVQRVHGRRQQRRCRRVEQRPVRHIHPEVPTQPGGDPDGQQGVTAQLEEIVVRADLVDAQQLGPDAGDRPLGGCTRRGERGGDVRAVALGYGQRPPVHLAVRGERQSLQHDVPCGQHVLGQLPRQRRAQPGHGHGRAAGRHQVRHQPLVARDVLADHDRGRRDGRPGQQGILDLSEFHPVPTQLDLVVHTAQVDQAPVRQPLHQIAGTVHACPGIGRERVRHEPPRCQIAPAQISEGDVDTPDQQFAGHSDRLNLTVRPDHVHLGVVDRPAHRHVVRRRVHRHRPADHVADGRLGRPVLVDDRGVPGAQDQRPVRQRRCQVLATCDHRGNAVPDAVLLQPGGQQLQVRGRCLQKADRDAGRDDVHGRVEHAASRLRPRHHQAQPLHQRQEQRGHRQVESHRRAQQRTDPRTGRRRIVPVAPVQVIDDTPVPDPHALGAARRTRGVDDVRHVVRARSGDRGAAGAGRPLPVGQQQRGARREQARVRGLRHHHRRGTVLDHVPQPLGRVGRVQRHVGGTRLEHAEQRAHQVRAVVQAHRDQRAGADAPLRQVPRQSLGPLVQLPVGQPLPAVLQGHRVGPARGPLLHQPVHGRGVRERGPGPVPLGQDPVPLRLRQHLQRAERLPGRVGGGTRERREVPRHPLRRGPFEQIGPVAEETAQPPAVRDDFQRDVRVRRERGGLPACCAPREPRHRAAGRVRQHRARHRTTADGVRHASRDMCQGLGERRVVGRAPHHGRRIRVPGAVRRHRHRNVSAAGVPRQQRVEHRQQDRGQFHAPIAGQRGQRVGGAGGHVERDPVRRARSVVRRPAVRRQFQRLKARQCVPPLPQLVISHRSLPIVRTSSAVHGSRAARRTARGEGQGGGPGRAGHRAADGTATAGAERPRRAG
ncbi:hypothetical protein EES42_23140 [Streptomyces sp. ADI95-17]|nr:hypothetical protein EES42_23140 [Streptomyces sp. ADI95-17]